MENTSLRSMTRRQERSDDATSFVSACFRKSLAILRHEWVRTGATGLAVLLMSGIVPFTLWFGYGRLLFDNRTGGAVDVNIYHRMVSLWLEGVPVYRVYDQAAYPPASFPILWLFLGGLDGILLRWFWAATATLALGWLMYHVVKSSSPTRFVERLFLLLLPLSLSGTAVTIANGQVGLHVLFGVVASILVLRRGEASWRTDLLGAALFLLALVKPTLSAPFFWMVVFLPGRVRPALFTVIGYVVLTLVSAAFQPVSLRTQLQDWWALTHGWVTRLDIGVANLHFWLSKIGLGRWVALGSLIMLIGVGAWTYLNRRQGIWLLMGVAALSARLWTYHRIYDDLLLFLPMVALFYITGQDCSPGVLELMAAMLLGMNMLVLIPWRLPLAAYNLPPLPILSQARVFVATLVFLMCIPYLRKRTKPNWIAP